MKNLMEKVWIRCGDGYVYQDFDSLEEAAKELKMNGVDKVKRFTRYGVISGKEYTGPKNYISLYWGSNDTQPIRGMSEQELKYINICLKS